MNKGKIDICIELYEGRAIENRPLYPLLQYFINDFHYINSYRLRRYTRFTITKNFFNVSV